MASSPYLERLKQIDQERISGRDSLVAQISGLPINKPQNTQNTQLPNKQPQNRGEMVDNSYQDSVFYKNLQNFQNEDIHFGGVLEELMNLSAGLRAEVENGFMPAPIAEQRIQQFVEDSMSHYQKNSKKLDKENKEYHENQQMEQLLGIIGQLGQNGPPVDQGQQPELPPEGVTPEQLQQLQGG